MNLSYETAVKLKEAGFPLKCASYTTEDFVFGVASNGLESVMYPLLSELIEACPAEITERDMNFGFTLGTGFSNPGWSAFYSWHDLCADPLGDGLTPEEAVANLWLALNGK